MKPFIRKGKVKDRVTKIQIVYKEGRVRKKIVHIGTAHNNDELEQLIEEANSIINANQLSFDLDDSEDNEYQDVYLEKSYSKTLWDALDVVYQKLGFSVIEDAIFKQLVLCRIIEPTSKFDSIRVMTELGLKAPSNSSIHRCLKRCIANDYRTEISKACFTSTSTMYLK